MRTANANETKAAMAIILGNRTLPCRIPFMVREARGGLTSSVAVLTLNDVPQRPHESRPGMFSNRQLGHCMARPPHGNSLADAAHTLLDVRVDLDACLVVFVGQLA